VKPIDADTGEAIERLRRSKEGQQFGLFLMKAFHEVQGRLLEDGDDIRMRTHQGEARALKVLAERWNQPTTGSDR
jgi:hypothetical protein